MIHCLYLDKTFMVPYLMSLVFGSLVWEGKQAEILGLSSHLCKTWYAYICNMCQQRMTQPDGVHIEVVTNTQ